MKIAVFLIFGLWIFITKTDRKRPVTKPDGHGDAVFAIGRKTEETFNCFALIVIGYIPGNNGVSAAALGLSMKKSGWRSASLIRRHAIEK